MKFLPLVDHLGGIASILSLPAAIIFIVSWWRQSAGIARKITLSVSLLVAIAAYGIDISDRLGWMKFSQNYRGVVLGWGTIGEQGAFYMTINSDLLLDYKREYKALMLLRAAYVNIDKMTDTAIEQSEFYTIAGGIMNIGFPLPRPYTNLHLQMSQPTTVLFVLAIVPNISTHDQIKSISDINRIGGEIVATPSATVTALP